MTESAPHDYDEEQHATDERSGAAGDGIPLSEEDQSAEAQERGAAGNAD